jgi:pimeloyl-ACP methyl ester carboxylesterase
VTGVESVDVELSHGRTRYFAAGDGPPLLLLHGVAYHAGAESWLPVMPLLASTRRVLAPDFVGWGPGDQLEQGYSFAYLTDFAREFQDALGIDRCDVIGHSMGGWIASLLAYESPGRVERLVLVAPGGVEVRPLASMQTWTPPGPDVVAAHYQPYAAMGVEIAPLIEAAVDRAGDEARTERFRRIMDHMTNHETRVRYATRRRLEHIVAPTLLVWGADDDLNPPSMGAVALELLPCGRLVTLSGAGHYVQVDAAPSFADVVSGFLLES